MGNNCCTPNNDPVMGPYFTDPSRLIKLLLLGAGESGKSTFFKQMKILYLKNSYDEAERVAMKSIVFTNLIENAITLIEAAKKYEKPVSEENQEAEQHIVSLNESTDVSSWIGLGEQVAMELKQLWADPAIKYAFSRASEFSLYDSAEYFFESIDRITQSDYVPTIDDILRLRIKTTGVTDVEVHIDNKFYFKFIDVGGQRAERRKWIHCFDDVVAVIFFASLSEYEQTLAEDINTNRMSESISLFKQLLTLECFNNTPFILFLNKYDLFEAKIKKIPLTVTFKEYKGRQDPEEASEYIRQQFASVVPKGRPMYVHKTMATDTNNIKVVFRAVKDVIIVRYLENMGLATI